MKKALLFLSTFLAFALASAQAEFHLTYEDAPLLDGDTITLTASNGSCDFWFNLTIEPFIMIPTVYSTVRLNESETYVSTICAGMWCIPNLTHSDSFAPSSFALEPNQEYENHIEFVVPGGAADALFSFTIYNEDMPENNVKFYVSVINPNAAVTIAEETPSISLYPNPASNAVNISLGENECPSTVALCNMAGQQVFTTVLPAGTGSMSLSVADLPKGLYTVTVTCGNRTTSKRLAIR